MLNHITVSVPGRICLFGEHQDYLHLPVITAAINRRITLTGQPNHSKQFALDLPDINGRELLDFAQNPAGFAYVKERDYFRSAFNVLLRKGISFPSGYDVLVKGTIPINSGTSSSSALIVAWLQFLLLAGTPAESIASDAKQIARLAHMAEVIEFGEPGGMMDHYATALGGTLFIDFRDGVHTEALQHKLGVLVLGDSQQPKETKSILHRVKDGVIRAVKIIQNMEPSFNLNTYKGTDISEFRRLLTTAEYEVLQGALLNRDITRSARQLLDQETFDHRGFGRMLTEHQVILAGKCRISTPRIDRMLQSALDAGAYGGKINGSGGGGCMFAYAPENSQAVAAAIEQAGGKAWIIEVDEGIRLIVN